MVKIASLVIVYVCMAIASGQRITTIQLDGVQYFISRMNPYSPELNYFLAYQYCRSLGLQLASFETKEKVESMTAYLQNAGYSKYDFWTSGNRLGTGMFLWMSTGLQFNATFDYFENSSDSSKAGNPDPFDNSGNTAPQRTARDSNNGLDKGCVILKAPNLKWAPEDCSTVKDFICEQTRCYYYNYGSIPVSSAQGRRIISSTTSKPPVSTTTIMTYNETNEQYDVDPNDGENNDTSMLTIEHETESEEIPSIEDNNKDVLESETVEDEILEHEDAPREMDSESEEFDEILHEIPEEVIVSDSVGENEKEKQFNLGNSTANNSSVLPNVFSLTDLINTFRLQDKKIPQIDSDYSNTLRVLGDLS